MFQRFVCQSDVSALAEILSKMCKDSHGNLLPSCRYGWNCCAAHDQARERQNTSGTWRSSGLRQLGLLGSHSTVLSQNPKSQCLLVQRGLLGPERETRPTQSPPAKPGLLRIAQQSATTKPELAETSGEAGLFGSKVNGRNSAGITAAAMPAGQAGPPGIAKQSATTKPELAESWISLVQSCWHNRYSRCCSSRKCC